MLMKTQNIIIHNQLKIQNEYNNLPFSVKLIKIIKK